MKLFGCFTNQTCILQNVYSYGTLTANKDWCGLFCFHYVYALNSNYLSSLYFTAWKTYYYTMNHIELSVQDIEKCANSMHTGKQQIEII